MQKPIASADVPSGSGQKGWRRTALALALAVVALSVIGMHQLSLGHLFVAAGEEHAVAAPAVALAEHSQIMAMGPAASAPAGEQAGAVAAAGGADPMLGDGCTGCGGHTMASGVCLLALTLLVLVWWLTPPKLRHAPPRPRQRPLPPPVAQRHRIPTLSLAELSILRV